MRKLLDFLVRKRHWFLFILLEIISIVWMYRNNTYQRSIIFSSANVVAGHISAVSGSLLSYLDLKQKNRELLDLNGRMEREILRLQDIIEMMQADSLEFAGFAPDSTETFPYHFTTAQVVSNSVTQLWNYIVIDKGRLDGIATDQGVVSQYGVVGIVSTVSDHFAVIIPLLNPKSRISCKVKGSNYFGSLIWDGRSIEYVNLEELPKHVDFQKGDTIITSGYSAVFPAGIMIGTIESHKRQHDDNFYSLQVKLATDFSSLSNVRVITNYLQEEQLNVEKEARRNDK